MIKYKISKKDEKVSNSSFPKLVKKDNAIVLAKNEFIGVVLTAHHMYNIGEEVPISCKDTEFNGILTFKNM